MREPKILVIIIIIFAIMTIKCNAALMIDLKVIIHYITKHPITFFDYSHKAKKMGIVELSKRYAVTPFGFTDTIEWTDKLPTLYYSKFDALPTNIIDNLLPQKDGTRLGTSIFISNQRSCSEKEKYLYALRSDCIKMYDQYIIEAFENINIQDYKYLHQYSLSICAYATWKIHFGNTPTLDNIHLILQICEMLTTSLNSVGSFVFSHPYIQLKHQFFEHLKSLPYESVCLFREWKKIGMTWENMYAEFAHNCFGMTIQWSYTIYQLLINKPIIKSYEDAANFILKHTPASVAASRISKSCTEKLILHDLEGICKHAKQAMARDRSFPFRINDWKVGRTETGAHVLEDQFIFEYNNYLPFGYGERRCPGEWLTYNLVINASHILNTYRYELKSTNLTVFIGLKKINKVEIIL